MSDPAPVEPISTPTPADMPMGREYIRRMNEAEKTGVTLDAPPQVEPEKPADEAPPTDPKPDEAERDAKGKFKGKPRHDPIARMTEATAEAARVKAENAELRRQLEARQAQPEPQRKSEPAPVPVGAPKLEDFYAEGRSPEQAVEAFEDARFEFNYARKRETERLNEEAARVNRENAERFNAAMADDEELSDLMSAADATLVKAGADPNAPFPAVMLEAIKRSEHGPQIARFLGSHPKELLQYAKDALPLPLSAATVVRRLLEAAVTASNPVPTAAIPTGSAAALPRPSAVPISPVRTSREPAPERDPSELAFGRDYVRKMNERERKGA